MTMTWSIGFGSSSKNDCSAAASFASKAAELPRAERERRLLQAVSIAPGKDDARALRAGSLSRCKSDSSAAADDDDNLIEQLRFALSGYLRSRRGYLPSSLRSLSRNAYEQRAL